MNGMTLVGLPRQFDQHAMLAAQSVNVNADLTTLVTRTQEAAGTDAGWQQHAQRVRGQLRLTHAQLSVSGSAMPRKLDDVQDQRPNTSCENAVTRLATMIGE